MGVRYEVQEWGQEYRDAAGERADMGVHLYDEQTIARILRNGGAVEIGALFFETVDAFLAFAAK